jgi:hypothetical protein
MFKKAILMVTAMVAAAVMGAAGPASAYAAGNSTWGVVCAFGKCVPSGTMLHVIDSRGVWVTYDRAQITSAGNICNWWIDFDYYDNSGRRYKHIQGAEHNSCTRNSHVRVDHPATGPQLWLAGRACATLYSAAIRITRQCHYLHP